MEANRKSQMLFPIVKEGEVHGDVYIQLNLTSYISCQSIQCTKTLNVIERVSDFLTRKGGKGPYLYKQVEYVLSSF